MRQCVDKIIFVIFEIFAVILVLLGLYVILKTENINALGLVCLSIGSLAVSSLVLQDLHDNQSFRLKNVLISLDFVNLCAIICTNGVLSCRRVIQDIADIRTFHDGSGIKNWIANLFQDLFRCCQIYTLVSARNRILSLKYPYKTFMFLDKLQRI